MVDGFGALESTRMRHWRPIARRSSLVEGDPGDAARAVAAGAVSRLVEGVGQFPFLRFVAPLGCRLSDDVVRLAVRADRCRACRACGPRRPCRRPPVGDLDRLLVRTKRIEKRSVCHVITHLFPFEGAWDPAGDVLHSLRDSRAILWPRDDIVCRGQAGSGLRLAPNLAPQNDSVFLASRFAVDCVETG